MFYVATLARYVIVEAQNEAQAQERGATTVSVGRTDVLSRRPERV
jgi:hypothetical protein